MASDTLLGGLAVVLNASEAQVKFAVIAGRFEDYAPVLSGSVLTTLRQMEDIQFSTEGAAFGAQWPPLAPSTIEGKARAGFGGRPMMVRTGALRDSLTTRGQGAVARISAFALIFGTDVPYAVYHQHLAENASLDKGIIPTRQVIPDPLPAEVKAELQDNIRNYLIEGRIR